MTEPITGWRRKLGLTRVALPEDAGGRRWDLLCQMVEIDAENKTYLQPETCPYSNRG